ncbi:MAG: hypothetical protein K1060chlam1_00343 [Candidatus Anoxychlamydiales bacterium]|nr:hypothetical protein [Candidatus Anoxychlamydiales bacterium]
MSTPTSFMPFSGNHDPFANDPTVADLRNSKQRIDLKELKKINLEELIQAAFRPFDIFSENTAVESIRKFGNE